MSVLATSMLPCMQMDKDSEFVTVFVVIVVTAEYCSQYRALNWICMSEVSVRICGTVLQFVCTSEWNTEILSIKSIQCDLGNAMSSTAMLYIRPNALILDSTILNERAKGIYIFLFPYSCEFNEWMWKSSLDSLLSPLCIKIKEIITHWNCCHTYY